MGVLVKEECITLEQYEAFSRGGKRIEVLMESAFLWQVHLRNIRRFYKKELLVNIRAYLKKKGGDCQVFPAPFDVKLSTIPLTIVQPDILVVCDRNKLDGNRCNGAPDFVIEIVSPEIQRMTIFVNCIIINDME